jgi:hypothetical protein
MSIRKWILTCTILALLALGTGCGLLGPGYDKVAEETSISKAIFVDWKAALEAYNVSGMLAPIDETGFTLNINDKGVPEASKDFTRLKQELQANEANQLRMRVQDGYKMTITFTDPAINVPNYAEATVSAKFKTDESTTVISEGKILSESGTINMVLDHVPGKWLVRSMTINFD